MKIILLTIIIVLFKNSYSQSILVKFWDKENKINFVNVYDAKNKINFNTGEDNKLNLLNNNYDLLISHVSYVSRKIIISNEDTLVNVYLERKLVKNEDVTVTSNKNLKYDILKFGNIKSKGKSKIQIKIDHKIGCLIRNEKKLINNYLKSFSFKINNPKKLKSYKNYIEVKFFELYNDSLISEPINSKEIRIPFSALKKINSIELKEQIEFPKDGLFVSIEILNFQNDNTNETSFEFPIEDKTGSYPALGTAPYRNWNAKMVNSKGHVSPFTNISFSLLIQLELKHYLEKKL